MLIGNSLPETLFIRVAVPALRLIAPLAILSCIIVLPVRPQLLIRHKWLTPFAIWLPAEALFFLVAYVPLRLSLQKAAQHPEPPCKEDREVLVQRILSSLTDPEYYLTKWFLNSPLEDIKRENVKEFYAWSFMNKRYEHVTESEEAELDSYTNQLETKMGRSIEPGRGRARSLRTTLDPVPMQHRPLVWYLIVALVETYSGLYLRLRGFHYHSARTVQALAVFPFALHSITLHRSPSSRISYWHHSRTSRSRTPILFIHGIGIGIYTCLSFLNELSTDNAGPTDDGSAGVIAVELPSISARICASAPSACEVKEEIRKILDQHGWNEVVLVAHSYGTAVASTMLRDHTFAKRIKAAILLDPICFMLHLPDVAYNFTRRQPRLANERMLFYFASQDMLISHTLARRFFWNQCILFKEDLPSAMHVTVSLSGQDLIVPTRAVWEYLTGQIAPRIGDTEWEDERLRVHWFDNLDHAGIFNSKGYRKGIAKEARQYSISAS